MYFQAVDYIVLRAKRLTAFRLSSVSDRPAAVLLRHDASAVLPPGTTNDRSYQRPTRTLLTPPPPPHPSLLLLLLLLASVSASQMQSMRSDAVCRLASPNTTGRVHAGLTDTLFLRIVERSPNHDRLITADNFGRRPTRVAHRQRRQGSQVVAGFPDSCRETFCNWCRRRCVVSVALLRRSRPRIDFDCRVLRYNQSFVVVGYRHCVSPLNKPTVV